MNWNPNGDGELTQAYSTGSIVGGTSRGGLIGEDRDVTGLGYGPGDLSTVVASAYWDADSSGISTSGKGTPLSTGLLKATLPTGFDPAIWGLDPSINDGYPYLLWQTASAPPFSVTTFTPPFGSQPSAQDHVFPPASGANQFPPPDDWTTAGSTCPSCAPTNFAFAATAQIVRSALKTANKNGLAYVYSDSRYTEASDKVKEALAQIVADASSLFLSKIVHLYRDTKEWAKLVADILSGNRAHILKSLLEESFKTATESVSIPVEQALALKMGYFITDYEAGFLDSLVAQITGKPGCTNLSCSSSAGSGVGGSGGGAS